MSECTSENPCMGKDNNRYVCVCGKKYVGIPLASVADDDWFKIVLCLSLNATL